MFLIFSLYLCNLCCPWIRWSLNGRRVSLLLSYDLIYYLLLHASHVLSPHVTVPTSLFVSLSLLFSLSFCLSFSAFMSLSFYLSIFLSIFLSFSLSLSPSYSQPLSLSSLLSLYPFSPGERTHAKVAWREEWITRSWLGSSLAAWHHRVSTCLAYEHIQELSCLTMIMIMRRMMMTMTMMKK